MSIYKALKAIKGVLLFEAGLFFLSNVHMSPRMCMNSVHPCELMCNISVQNVHIKCKTSKLYCAHL